MRLQLIAAVCAALAVAACQAPETPDAEAPAEPAASVEPSQTANCAVIESREWTAHINAMPGPNAQRTLVVTGQIDVPTPGYALALTAGMADRSAIPAQTLNLELTPPEGMVAQVIATETARYEGPAIAEQYSAVRIVCSGTQLAEITDIQTAR
ncbi:MAG: hypothetical protein AB7P07_02935 [Hyphomonadaceae bacterium]